MARHDIALTIAALEFYAAEQAKDAGRRKWSGEDPRLVAYRANRRDDARRLRQLAKGLTMAADTATELLTDRVTIELMQS